MLRQLKSILPCSLVALAVIGGNVSAAEPNAALKALIEAANKEGALNLIHGQSVIGGIDGARAIEQKMNEQFGTTIKVSYAPGPSMHRRTRQLVDEYKAGTKSSADILIGWAPSMQMAAEADVLAKVDWAGLLPDRIRPEFVETGGTMLRFGVTFPVISYNKNLAPMVPTTLADMMRPEWKGKFATTPYVAGYPMLASPSMWGEAKTVEFLRKLSTQVGGLIRCGAEVERVATGEYAALAMDCIAGNTITWQQRGAPLEYAIPADAAQLHYYYLTVPKHAKNPNAAKLFTVFMLSEAGQALNWDTWKIDLNGQPGSNMGAIISKLKDRNIKFTEVTMAWWTNNPQLNKIERQLMKIVSKK